MINIMYLFTLILISYRLFVITHCVFQLFPDHVLYYIALDTSANFRF